MIIFLKNGCSLVHESPHEKMHNYIEFAWACSTIFGILLFMIEVTILCWIQFYCLVKEAAYIATAILVPCVFLFVWFAVTFYRNLTTHTYETRKTGIKELEELKTVLEMQDDLTMRPWNYYWSGEMWVQWSTNYIRWKLRTARMWRWYLIHAGLGYKN